MTQLHSFSRNCSLCKCQCKRHNTVLNNNQVSRTDRKNFLFYDATPLYRITYCSLIISKEVIVNLNGSDHLPVMYGNKHTGNNNSTCSSPTWKLGECKVLAFAILFGLWIFIAAYVLQHQLRSAERYWQCWERRLTDGSGMQK